MIIGARREELFWGKVNKTPSCWLWTANKNPKGYGMFRISSTQTASAHRVSYALAYGAVPDKALLDHVCHVRHCVNPEHLRCTTTKQNSENRSGVAKNNTSGIRGVSWNKAQQKWNAYVGHNWVQYKLGFFDSIEEAATVVLAKRLELHTHNDSDRKELLK